MDAWVAMTYKLPHLTRHEEKHFEHQVGVMGQFLTTNMANKTRTGQMSHDNQPFQLV